MPGVAPAGTRPTPPARPEHQNPPTPDASSSTTPRDERGRRSRLRRGRRSRLRRALRARPRRARLLSPRSRPALARSLALRQFRALVRKNLTLKLRAPRASAPRSRCSSPSPSSPLLCLPPRAHRGRAPRRDPPPPRPAAFADVVRAAPAEAPARRGRLLPERRPGKPRRPKPPRSNSSGARARGGRRVERRHPGGIEPTPRRSAREALRQRAVPRVVARASSARAGVRVGALDADAADVARLAAASRKTSDDPPTFAELASSLQALFATCAADPDGASCRDLAANVSLANEVRAEEASPPSRERRDAASSFAATLERVAESPLLRDHGPACTRTCRRSPRGTRACAASVDAALGAFLVGANTAEDAERVARDGGRARFRFRFRFRFRSDSAGEGPFASSSPRSALLSRS